MSEQKRDGKASDEHRWKKGLPPGEFYEGMVDDFEVSYTIGGLKWHRRRTDDEKAEYIAHKARIAAYNESVRARKDRT